MEGFLDLKTPEYFWETVKKELSGKNLEIKSIYFEDSINRILSQDIISKENLPDFNRSTVDGYALRSKDVRGVSASLPGYFSIIGEVKMGKNTDITIKKGQTAYIPTGGMLPAGADCVAMVEYTEKISEDMIECNKSYGVGDNIIKKGEEIKKGEIIFKKGYKFTSRDLGVLAGLGLVNFEVFKKPEVVIISTGDELVEPWSDLKFGEIRDINTYTLSSLFKRIGAEVIKVGIIKDSYSVLKENIKKYLDKDLILVSGGSSAGIKDITVDVINELGSPGVLIHGLKVKPGKPTILGLVNGTPIMGLPGHPGSAWMIANKFVGPLLKILTGEYDKNDIVKEINKDLIKEKAVLTKSISSDKGREEVIPVKKIYSDKIKAEPLLGKSSFMRIFIESDRYIEIESSSEGIDKGKEVELIKFN
ncbi:MAG: molybdopterin molybdotransferase MoeA [Halanaerobiales bacterium]|nr:molybdopterin molybdotransferase MoeA [Halanaerobiales bacterium]